MKQFHVLFLALPVVVSSTSSSKRIEDNNETTLFSPLFEQSTVQSSSNPNIEKFFLCSTKTPQKFYNICPTEPAAAC